MYLIVYYPLAQQNRWILGDIVFFTQLPSVQYALQGIWLTLTSKYLEFLRISGNSLSGKYFEYLANVLTPRQILKIFPWIAVF